MAIICHHCGVEITFHPAVGNHAAAWRDVDRIGVCRVNGRLDGMIWHSPIDNHSLYTTHLPTDANLEEDSPIVAIILSLHTIIIGA